jgi:hypothetical protein
MIRMPTISKYIAFVQVDDITTCTENCWGRRERVRETDKGDWTDQSTVYSQLRYIKKTPLNTDFGVKNWKIGPIREWVFVGGRWVNEGKKGRWTWLIYFRYIDIYIWDRTMKPFAIVLSGKEGFTERDDRGEPN